MEGRVGGVGGGGEGEEKRNNYPGLPRKRKETITLGYHVRKYLPVIRI